MLPRTLVTVLLLLPSSPPGPPPLSIAATAHVRDETTAALNMSDLEHYIVAELIGIASRTSSPQRASRVKKVPTRRMPTRSDSPLNKLRRHGAPAGAGQR